MVSFHLLFDLIKTFWIKYQVLFVNGLLQIFAGTLSVKKYILKEFYWSFHFTIFFLNIFYGK